MKNWIKKHPIIFTLAVFLFTPAALNYSGFCMAEGRWLSDEERIRIGLPDSKLLLGGQGNVSITDNGKQSGKWMGSEMVEIIPYANIEDFIQRNQNCCEVDRNLSGDFPPVSWIDVVLGRFATKIRKTYTVHYIDKTQTHRTQEIKSEFIQTNCGKGW